MYYNRANGLYPAVRNVRSAVAYVHSAVVNVRSALRNVTRLCSLTIYVDYLSSYL